MNANVVALAWSNNGGSTKSMKCLDHTYTTNPEKISEVTAEMSRYTKSLKNNPRYVCKRCFKNFDVSVFKQKVSEMPELNRILECQCASQEAEFFTLGFTKVLDIMAPIKTIQNRNNYAAHIQETTKQLMERRNASQRQADRTGSQEDWREYQGLRNQCVAA